MRTLATRHYGTPFIPRLDNGHFKFDVSFRNHEFGDGQIEFKASLNYSFFFKKNVYRGFSEDLVRFNEDSHA